MYSRLVVGTSFTRSYTGTRRLAFTSSRSHVFQSISRRSANGHQSVPVPVLNTLTKDKSNYNKLSRFVTSSKALTVEEPTGSHEKGDLFKELTQLSATIRSHDKLYYTSGGTPLVTDEEYDALTQREAEICRAHPELQARLESESGLGSSTTRYGGRVGPVIPVLEGEQILTTRIIKEKRAHLETSPMQSLDNAMNGEQVVNWINRVRKLLNTTDDDMEEKVGEKNGVNIIAEPKMDGLSLSLRYKLQDAAVGRYQLQWGATRGDGKRGEDVTEAVLAMDRGKLTSNGEQGGIPMSFTCFGLPDIVEIRGEVVLPTSTFSELSQNTTISDKESKVDNAVESSGTLGHFSNARNAASGILLRRKAESELSDQEVKDTQELRSYLRFYAYSIGLDMKGNDELCTSGVELRNFLETIGFTVANPVEIAYIPFNTTEDITEKECQALFTYHDRIMSNRLDYNGQNASSVPFDFDVDGAVYKISVLDDRRRIGSSSRAPRWAIAHKFPAQCAVTRLLGVEVQIGRTGALTPVAVLEPVDIGGVTVSRASLHNFAWAKALLADDDESFNGDRVPKGASVMISRAGDVIPQVLKRLDNEATFVQNKTDDDIDYISLTPPRKCPACGSESVFELIQGKCKPPEEGNDDENGLPSEESLTEYSQNSSITESPSTGQVLRCGGPQLFCPPRAIGAMAHTFSRSGLDISGLSEARLQQLNNASLIQLPSDLFDVLDAESTILDQIASLPGWGEKSAMNLKHAVQATSEKEVPLNQFIYSLGIRHVGVHNSDLIASAYGSVSHFFDAVKESSHANNSNSNDNSEPVDVFPDLVGTDDVEGVKGIGPVIIDSLVIFSKNSELVEAAECLASKLNIKDMIVSNESPTKQIDLPFDGKTVVFTGSLPNGMTRKQAQSLAMTSLGAKSTPGSVSKATGIVIEGDKGGKKVEKAKELGVTVMSADDFIALAEKYK
jgi:DNA ligase (NAD+)